MQRRWNVSTWLPPGSTSDAVPPTCPKEQRFAGSLGEQRRMSRERAGQRRARSGTIRIRDLPSWCLRCVPGTWQHGAADARHLQRRRPDDNPDGSESAYEAEAQACIGQGLERLVSLGSTCGKARETDDGEARQGDEEEPQRCHDPPERATAVQQESTATTATTAHRHRPQAAARPALQSARATPVPDGAGSHGESRSLVTSQSEPARAMMTQVSQGIAQPLS